MGQMTKKELENKRRAEQEVYKMFDNIVESIKVDNITEDVFGGVHSQPKQKVQVFPKHNLYVLNGEYFLEFALAGYKKEDIGLEVVDSMLYITAEKQEHSNREYIDRNVTFKKAQRKFTIDKNVDIPNITSTFENGLLTICLAMKEEKQSSVHSIAID